MKLEHEAQVLIAEIAQFLGGEAAHVDAIHHDAATIWLVEGTDNLEQGSLAGTTRTYDAYHLTFIYMQVDALEHLQGVETLGYTFYIYHLYSNVKRSVGKITQNNWKSLILYVYFMVICLIFIYIWQKREKESPLSYECLYI